jgi:hypothetical protein
MDKFEEIGRRLDDKLARRLAFSLRGVSYSSDGQGQG